MIPLPPRRSPEETRRQILDAAIQLAAEDGAMAFTLDAVVSRLPFSKGALLHHFPSKSALLEGMIDALAREYVAEVLAEAEKDDEPYNRTARAALRMTVNRPADDKDHRIGRAALLASAIEPGLSSRWREGLAPLYVDDPLDAAGQDDALMMRLLATGLWVSDLFGLFDVTTDQRKAVAAVLTGPEPA